MNRWRIAGLVLLALLAASLLLLLWRFLARDEVPVPPPQQPAREAFHASKPLRVQVASAQDASAGTQAQWLDYELRRLLSRAKMRVTPLDALSGESFTLQVEIAPDSGNANLSLIAPDQVVERTQRVAFADTSRLGVLTTLATSLPTFLDATHGARAWSELIGTNDAKAYDTFLNAALDLLGPAAAGLTRPESVAQRTRTVERLEGLTRSQPQFARAWAALAAGYLGLGGQDEASLSELAESSAEKALSVDAEIAEAHAVIGLVHLRRSEWIAARDQFERALALDINSAPALEGYGCLLVDAGQHAAARPIIHRALAVQPNNAGSVECLAYVDPREQAGATEPGGTRATYAEHVRAVAAILAGDTQSAQQILRRMLGQRAFNEWAQPLLRAASDRSRVPDALKAVTVAASEGRIDPWVEILWGAALRQSDFVFNRLSRLQRREEQTPLRVLWMAQTDFLRRHSRFEPTIATAGLPAFWQEYGAPDVCATETKLAACKLRPAAGAPKKKE